MTPGGSYAEYAVAWDHTTIHLPDSISFQGKHPLESSTIHLRQYLIPYLEAATLPLACLTSAVGLYTHDRLALSPPWSPVSSDDSSTPVIVYGGSTAVGSYAIQLLQRSNIHPIITIAGAGIPHVKTLITPSRGDVIIDYRSKSHDQLVKEMKDALGGKKCVHALDAVSDHGSFEATGEVLAEGGRIALVLPGKDYSALPKHVAETTTKVGDVHTEGFADFGFVAFQMMARGLRDGWFKPHPYEVIEGGLNGVESGLARLKEGKASAVKYIYEIAATKGVS